jgi:mannose-1-phosphate guanylyltransferase
VASSEKCLNKVLDTTKCSLLCFITSAAQHQQRSEEIMKVASWVIRNKATKTVIFETFNENTAKAINTNFYEAIPILEPERMNKPGQNDADGE